MSQNKCLAWSDMKNKAWSRKPGWIIGGMPRGPKDHILAGNPAGAKIDRDGS